MSGEAIALLITTGVLFGAGVGWIVYWWNRPIFPKTPRFTNERGPWTIDVFGERISTKDAMRAADAVHAAILAWVPRQGPIQDGFDGRNLIAVRFESKTWFDEQHRFGIAGYLDSVHFRRGGWYYPMLVIRDDFLEQVRRSGNPVIHEMLHALQRDEVDEKDYEHSDPVVWAQAGGKDSIEAVAKQVFEGGL